MNSHHISNDIFLWLAIKCAYFKRKFFSSNTHLAGISFCIEHVPSALLGEPTKQATINLSTEEESFKYKNVCQKHRAAYIHFFFAKGTV